MPKVTLGTTPPVRTSAPAAETPTSAPATAPAPAEPGNARRPAADSFVDGGQAATRAAATEIPAGYRWSASVLDAVMAEYGLTDAKALIAAAVARDNGNRYLAKDELRAAAAGLRPTAPGYSWSPNVLARVMAGAGLSDAQALIDEARKHDNGNRYLSRAELEAAAKVLTGAAAELGIISDLDKTVIPPSSGTSLPAAAYPGVGQLYKELEGRNLGDVFFVTARGPDRITDIPAWLEEQGVPAGPIDTGTGTQPWIAEPEKVADILRILDAHPNQKFLLFGDTSHRDPEVYREVMRQRPDQVLGVFIHKVNKETKPARVEGMSLVENYAVAAAELYRTGVLTEAAARRVMVAAQLQGLDITDADIDRLLADHRPA